MAKTIATIEGVVIGVFLGFGDDGPLVVFPGNLEETAITARSLTELDSAMIGAEVALLFQEGDPGRPLIVGRIVDPARKTSTPQVIRDGETVKINADERMELRCGKATSSWKGTATSLSAAAILSATPVRPIASAAVRST